MGIDNHRNGRTFLRVGITIVLGEFLLLLGIPPADSSASRIFIDCCLAVLFNIGVSLAVRVCLADD